MVAILTSWKDIVAVPALVSQIATTLNVKALLSGLRKVVQCASEDVVAFSMRIRDFRIPVKSSVQPNCELAKVAYAKVGATVGPSVAAAKVISV